MNMEFYRKLPIPKDIKEQFPLSAASEKALKSRVEEINKILKQFDQMKKLMKQFTGNQKQMSRMFGKKMKMPF